MIVLNVHAQSDSTSNCISFDAGIGFGASYGILGVRAQGRILNDRIGGFLGIGHCYWLNVKPNILFSGGLKFYPYKNTYLSVQYNCVGSEPRKISISPDEYAPRQDSPFYAFTAMAGGDFMLWKNLGLNVAGGFAYYTKKNNNILFVMDAGVFWKFL